MDLAMNLDITAAEASVIEVLHTKLGFDPSFRPTSNDELEPLTTQDKEKLANLLAKCGGGPAALVAVKTWRPCAVACIKAAFYASNPLLQPAPVTGTRGFGAQLAGALREIWRLSLEELATNGCPWLRLPDVGVLDLATCWNALREPRFRKMLIPNPNHPLHRALETPIDMVAILVAAPDGTEPWSATVQEDVRELASLLRDDQIVLGTHKHVKEFGNCASPDQICSYLQLLGVISSVKQVLFFFAGRGSEETQALCMGPLEKQQYVAALDLTAALANIGDLISTTRVVILDCCFMVRHLNAPNMAVLALSGSNEKNLTGATTKFLIPLLRSRPQCESGKGCEACDLFCRQAHLIDDGWIKFTTVATWLQHHLKTAAHHSANITLCRYLPDRRWDRLPARNASFVGRKELLQDMEERCFGDVSNGGQVVALALTNALAGSGGVGKTQSAIEFAHRHLEKYTGFCRWVAAENVAQATAQLAEVAKIARVATADKPTRQWVSEMYQALDEGIFRDQGWLLIFDNATDPPAISELLPVAPLKHGRRHHIIVTSRSQEWGAAQVVLDVLTADEARQFVRARLNHLPHCAAEPDSVVDQLATDVGHLPLALALACAYISHSAVPLTIEGYTGLLQTTPMRALGEWKGLKPEYPHTVATTWTLSIQQLSDQALAVLAVMAVLAPDNIPLDLCFQAAGVMDTMALEEELTRFSLVSINGVAQASVHRLVQRVIRHQLLALTSCSDNVLLMDRAISLLQIFGGKPGSDQPLYGLVLNRVLGTLWWEDDGGKYMPSDPQGHADYAKYRMLLPHLEHLREQADRIAAQSSLGISCATLLLRVRALRMLRRGRVYLSSNNVQLLEVCEAELALVSTQPHHQKAELVGILGDLGRVLYFLGNFAAAEERLNMAVAMCHEAPDGSLANTIEAAQAHHVLGSVLKKRGMLEQAEAELREGLRIAVSVCGNRHPKVAIGLNSLGKLLEAKGKLAEAETVLQKSLGIEVDAYGTDQHAHVAITLHALGQLQQAQGKFAEAEETLRKSLGIKIKAYNTEQHASVATTYHSLGQVLHALGKLHDAESMLRKSLEIKIWGYGTEDHPSVRATRLSLEQVLLALREPPKVKDHAPVDATMHMHVDHHEGNSQNPRKRPLSDTGNQPTKRSRLKSGEDNY